MKERGQMRDTVHKKLVREYYSKRAEDYDKQKSRTWKIARGFSNEVTEALVQALRNCRKKLVLEVCVGTGRTSFSILEEIHPLVVGLDLSREMLKATKAKMPTCGHAFDLVLGDAECLPFADEVFGALVCTSAMHYFGNLGTSAAEFNRVLHQNGCFAYGDLTLHESDKQHFLDRLERTISRAHGSYNKPSEVKKMLEETGFVVSQITTVPYRKSFQALIEDKARYFGVAQEALDKCIKDAAEDERKLYATDRHGLTLFYTIIKALKQKSS